MQGIAYTELYVSDGPAAISYFTGGMDFVPVAEAHRSDRDSVVLRAGEIHLVISSPTTTDSPVSAWLSQHGDGIADIAMYRRDAPEAVTRAALAGLPLIRPVRHSADGHVYGTIGGLGSVEHTLIDPGRASEPILPPEFAWRPIRGAHGAESTRLQLIDHVAACLPLGALASSAWLYRHVFGMKQISRELRPGDVEMDSRVLRDATGSITFVLTEPTLEARGGQIEQFIRQHASAGIQHLAFACTAITDTVADYIDHEVAFCATPSAYYRSIPERLADYPQVQRELEALHQTGVLVTSDHGGLLYQIFTRSPHERATVFYELVERQGGASGFGTDNIKALFEAREADLTQQATEQP
ncbi:4-hydroxyphenylpyruvate dioxygenase [Actinoallomurus acanthiterrae]